MSTSDSAPNDGPSDAAAAASEHLIAAAHELISAGRLFLDGAERALTAGAFPPIESTLRRWVDLGHAVVEGFSGPSTNSDGGPTRASAPPNASSMADITAIPIDDE